MNNDSTIDLARLSAMDTALASRLLKGVREATLSGRRPQVLPRTVIGESWGRMLRDGVDPEQDFRSGILSVDEVEERRQSSPLLPVLPVLREALVEGAAGAAVAEAAQHIMVISDADGRILWREGHPAVLRKGDRHGYLVGAHWAESVVGTNGVGTPLVTRRPIQVFSAEHFVRSHHQWTCTGAPLTDPRDGRLIGAVTVSGPLETMHPATLSWVTSVARLAEARLREQHMGGLERLRAVAAPLLARMGGRALAVDRHGWPAAVTGMPLPERVALPRSLAEGACWIPSLGTCRATPLPGGWLLIPAEDVPEPLATTRITLDLGRPRRPVLQVTGGAASWCHELSPRHAELLYLLARHPHGRTAADLADDLFGDPRRTVTVRAEMSRVRRYLGTLLAHRPYRFAEEAEVDVVLPGDPLDLLPHSAAPAVVRARSPLP
ncbi:helix-turn-helix domain-containing protein [Streptomyces sp. VRA16 Mangrove soil]|uniref:helix-turn-helix domain-containing protein n=1 Tax=Streptomyces sp. VRA16 Mangrove soil TaxID=2817434 RepID=UPI001A9CEFEC|nr:helix-turn-helix domain-containing protein [Streptomyces sp. VRA16 Mangrove soil]MBO1335466.1 GAF domain-containing protein [Streptomyces sp. VRA16 Mangrove soil]